jgi:hypothetical protein
MIILLFFLSFPALLAGSIVLYFNHLTTINIGVTEVARILDLYSIVPPMFNAMAQITWVMVVQSTDDMTIPDNPIPTRSPKLSMQPYPTATPMATETPIETETPMATETETPTGSSSLAVTPSRNASETQRSEFSETANFSLTANLIATSDFAPSSELAATSEFMPSSTPMSTPLPMPPPSATVTVEGNLWWTLNGSRFGFESLLNRTQQIAEAELAVKAFQKSIAEGIWGKNAPLQYWVQPADLDLFLDVLPIDNPDVIAAAFTDLERLFSMNNRLLSDSLTSALNQ